MSTFKLAVFSAKNYDKHFLSMAHEAHSKIAHLHPISHPNTAATPVVANNSAENSNVDAKSSADTSNIVDAKTADAQAMAVEAVDANIVDITNRADTEGVKISIDTKSVDTNKSADTSSTILCASPTAVVDQASPSTRRASHSHARYPSHLSRTSRTSNSGRASHGAHGEDMENVLSMLEALRASGSFAMPQVELVFHDFPLSIDTVSLAQGAAGVCVFVNDSLDEEVLEALHDAGVRAVLLRCAGYNNVDLGAAERLGMFVANVPSYSPQAVAEFSVALLQTLNRQTHRAYNRVREGNFSLDGLLGRTLHGKTVGVIGTGRIGLAAARILQGYGCRLLAYDPFPTDEFAPFGTYVDLDTLLPQCDFVSLHCPLTDGTRHIINADSLARMKPGALLVNTSRGGLIDTRAVIAALKSHHLGGLALDVYESEGSLFYNDHSGDIIDDDDLMRLMTFPNVIVCGHQAFFTQEALSEIATSTLHNLDDYLRSHPCKNSLVRSHKLYARRDSFPVRI